MGKLRKTDKYRLIEGRGKGMGINYKPWLKVHEFGSNSRAHRLLGWKAKRIYQLMSDLELNFFLLAQWEDDVVDIREQFPMLPIETTTAIAKDLGIIHPPIRSKSNDGKIVMTTDFILTKSKGLGEFENIARTIKPTKELEKKRVKEKFRIEEEYWRRKNIDWDIVTERDIPKTKAMNIYFIYLDYFWDEDRDLSKYAVSKYIYDFKNILIKNSFNVKESIAEFEYFKNLEKGEGLSFYRYLLAKKEINTNFDIKFDLLNMNVWID